MVCHECYGILEVSWATSRYQCSENCIPGWNFLKQLVLELLTHSEEHRIFITVYYTTHSDFIQSLVFSLIAFVIALPCKVRPREDAHTHTPLSRMSREVSVSGSLLERLNGQGFVIFLAQSYHKFPLLFHPHLWLLGFSITHCFWQFLQRRRAWEARGAGAESESCPGCAFLDVYRGCLLTVSIVAHSWLMSKVFLSDSFLSRRSCSESCLLTGLGIFLLLSRVLRVSSSLFQNRLDKLL